MTQPRILTSPPAEDFETISFRAPRRLCLSARIREAAEASGETREDLIVARLRASLGVADETIYRGRP